MRPIQILLLSSMLASSCVGTRASPGADLAADVLLICGEAPRPSARPAITAFLESGTWMVKMTQLDLERVMVDQDLLVAWEKCAVDAIALVASPGP